MQPVPQRFAKYNTLVCTLLLPCTAAESFRYYSEGVYYNSECSIKSGDLDHAVVLFGYGTTDDGEDYWLVRNTW